VSESSRGRRLYAPVVLGLLAVGGGTWLSLGRTWGRTTLRPDGLPPDTVSVTGRDAVPLAAALAVVVVAAALAVLATRGRGRLVVGALVLVLGVVGAWQSFASASAIDDAARAAAEQSPAFTGQALGDVATTVWPWASGAGFVLAGLVGLVVLRHGRSWPGLSGRYEAPSRRVDDDPWKALDDGRDPTL
jgi:uncharacterized membrane protein (TIGR02234 family)